jgi:hypothetical protein
MRVVKLTAGGTSAADFWILAGFKSAKTLQSNKKALFGRFQCEFSLSSQFGWLNEQKVRRLVDEDQPS